MKNKIVWFGLLAVTAGAFAYTRPHNHIPADLRDAVSDSSFEALKTEAGGEASGVSAPEPEIKPFYVETGSRKALGNKGYVAGTDSLAGAPVKPVEFITIPGGKFTMGTDSGEKGFEDAKPIHEVAIKTFEMSKTVVTVEQYAECVIKGGCTEPATGDYCNWGKPGRQLHPVNCVDWDQAQAYAKFKGARLPSEAEFEYAATSGGRNQKYPWGNDEPTCDKAVMKSNSGYGCGTNSTMPVCSKPKGNTAQGLCDMSGNVWQWVQDKYQDSYKGAPTDGSAFEAAGSGRVIRGGSFNYDDARVLRADLRLNDDPGDRNGGIGFRLVRSR
ncbi:MAG: formylglycine-generating enzyme family protein [Elusimicrobiales bacterium]|nr:formylglycine-generating enzyme family protein [Elusimicrobiales bacterium]